MLFLLIALQAGDWLTTRAILAHGGYERNPVIRWLMGKLGVDPALAVKTVVVIVIGFVLTGLPILFIGLLCGFYAWVVVNNWRVLQRLKSNH